MNKATCVQCHRDLDFSVNDDSIKSRIFVCHRADCPNFALLCISLEKMLEVEEVKHLSKKRCRM